MDLSNLTEPQSVNLENVQHCQSYAIKLGLVDAQSVKNKVDELVDYVIENIVDIAALTET